MLITDEVYNLMTEGKKHLRLIDRVLPDEDSKPMDLYTVDMQPLELIDEMGLNEDKKLSGKEKRQKKVYQSINRKDLQEGIAKEGVTKELWNSDEIKTMQEPYSSRFYDEWKIAFERYVSGNWEAAVRQLQLTNDLGPNGVDGPSLRLIKFI